MRERPVASRVRSPAPSPGDALAEALTAARAAGRDDLVEQALDGIFEVLYAALRTARYGHDPRTFRAETSLEAAADAGLPDGERGHP